MSHQSNAVTTSPAETIYYAEVTVTDQWNRN